MDIVRERFHDKRVLVVGAAFSGTEVASLLVQFAKSVTVTFRNPVWYVPRWVKTRLGGRYYPLDLVFYNRSSANPLIRTPAQFLTSVAGNPGDVSPELAFDENSDAPFGIVITDEFLNQVRAGLVSPKRSATLSFDATGVTFSDGRRQEIDAVVMCTGFTSTLPFLDPGQLQTIGFKPQDQLQPTLLHRHIFHPDLPGLAFVGHYRGPYFPVMELQSRWIARIIAGEVPLPSRDAMLAGIEDERQLREKWPRPQFPHGDFVGLADGLARDVGAFPRLPPGHPLFDHIEKGPVVPAHYRLIGPHAQPDLATKLILAAPAPLLEKNPSYADAW
jgi:dimethylaniline monooxygenase (N-oxide forming)